MLAAGGRVAIYAAPRPCDPLWEFGSATIGYDAARCETISRRPPLGLTRERWATLTAEPRRYGFHATLKAPFGLSDGASLECLSEAVRGFCEGAHALAPFRLEVRTIGEFLALVPASAPDDLASFATSIVTSFDRFRAPLSNAERERRLAAELNERQIGNLERWGYPYVLEDFRFHMSLTGKVADDALRDELRAALTESFHHDTGSSPFALDALALFIQPAAAGSFQVHERHALGSARP
jgi:putative phosphonate metabolism protein